MTEPSTKSTGELVAQAFEDALGLLRKEFELLKIGLTEALSDRLKGAGLVAGAALVLFPGVLFLFVALALWFPGSPALGFFALGVIMLAAAGAAVFVGVKKLKKGGRGSGEAFDKLKEDARWARERVKS